MLKSILIISLLSLQVMAKEVVLDVRTPDEYKADHVEGAVNLSVTSPGFRKQVEKLDREDSFKVYCKSGARSSKAISVMKDLGFKKLENMGGLDEAKKQIYVK